MNNREFRNRLQAIARGEIPAEKSKSPIQELQLERQRPPQKEPPAKKPPVKSKQSAPKLGYVRVRFRSLYELSKTFRLLERENCRFRRYVAKTRKSVVKTGFWKAMADANASRY
jgi:hypothetical protein